MNTKILTAASLLIALLCHLVLFNLCTIVFEIDPASPKPNFFFLGPILKQNDLWRPEPLNHGILPDEDSQKSQFQDNGLIQLPYQSAEKESSPFAIKTIRKPLTDTIPDSQQKEVIKSTFNAEQEELPGKESGPPVNDPGIIVPSYKPLQFRTR